MAGFNTFKGPFPSDFPKDDFDSIDVLHTFDPPIQTITIGGWNAELLHCIKTLSDRCGYLIYGHVDKMRGEGLEVCLWSALGFLRFPPARRFHSGQQLPLASDESVPKDHHLYTLDLSNRPIDAAAIKTGFEKDPDYATYYADQKKWLGLFNS
jgi:hypothetical protein